MARAVKALLLPLLALRLRSRRSTHTDHTARSLPRWSKEPVRPPSTLSSARQLSRADETVPTYLEALNVSITEKYNPSPYVSFLSSQSSIQKEGEGLTGPA